MTAYQAAAHRVRRRSQAPSCASRQPTARSVADTHLRQPARRRPRVHDPGGPAVRRPQRSAQTLANSLEILGDAQPTQANYDQVLNTFNVGTAISQLQAGGHDVGERLDRRVIAPGSYSGTSASSP